VVVTNFHEINELIDKEDWVWFGKEKSFCQKPNQPELKLYRDTGKIPEPCNRCYKALIFWENNFTKENIGKFVKVINEVESRVTGRFDRELAVFYFRDRVSTEQFLDFLGRKMMEHNISGTTQWRRACKFYQELHPHGWRNSKEYVPPKAAH
jgi:hypothetical protein